MQGGVPNPNRFVECIWLRNFRATQISTSFSLVACVLVLYDLGLQPHHAKAQELRKLSEGAGEEVDAGTIAVETSRGTYYWSSFFLDDLQGIPFPKCTVNANLYSSQRCSCTYFRVVLSIWTVAAADRDLKFWKQSNTKKPPLETRCSFLEIIFFWMGIITRPLPDSPNFSSTWDENPEAGFSWSSGGTPPVLLVAVLPMKHFHFHDHAFSLSGAEKLGGRVEFKARRRITRRLRVICDFTRNLAIVSEGWLFLRSRCCS